MESNCATTAFFEADADHAGRLLRFLGLDRFIAAGCRIGAVRRVLDSLTIGLDWPGIGSGEVVMAQAGDTPAFLKTAHIAIAYKGTDVSRPFAVILHRLAKNAATATIDDLFNMIGAIAPTTAPDDDTTVNQIRRSANPINDWGADEQWSELLCDHAMERKFYDIFEFEESVSFIVHGDLECRFVTPGARFELPRFIRYPWPIFSHEEGVGPISDLDDTDIISGTTDKLETAIRNELDRRDHGGPVIVLSTCAPVVVGDDIDWALNRMAPLVPDGLFNVTPRDSTTPTELYLKGLDAVRRRFETAGERVIPNTVALVGWRSCPARDELTAMLGEAGIDVVGTILPVGGVRMMEQVLHAETLVFMPSVYHNAMYERVLGGLNRRRISPTPPWGPSHTSEWAIEIGRSAGREDAIREVAYRHETETTRTYPEINKDTGVIVFAISPGQENRLLDPLSATGLPILPVTAELGLPVRVLVRDDGTDRTKATVTHLADAGFGDIAEFRDEEGLRELLQSPDVTAVFSEYGFDYRITKSGAFPFSTREFEMGFAGAARTANRLARISGTPFFQRFHRHLANTPHSGT